MILIRYAGRACRRYKYDMPDDVKLIQSQLQGLQGKSSLLSKEEFEYMHDGVPESSIIRLAGPGNK